MSILFSKFQTFKNINVYLSKFICFVITKMDFLNKFHIFFNLYSFMQIFLI